MIRQRRRRGFGLLEVIVCTGLVAILVMPLATVVRASARSIAAAEGAGTTEAELREALAWISNVVRDARIVFVRRSVLRLESPAGDRITIRVLRGRLQIIEPNQRTFILTDVRNIQFRDLTQKADPSRRIGVEIALQKRDLESGRNVLAKTTVAVRPQL